MLKKTIAVLSMILVPLLLFAQDGKLRGRVVDKESGEPLIGATVTLEGTTLGASTDISGDYIVLAVPGGVYSVKANYIGYAAYTISNVRISSAQTTSLDFRLTSSAVQVGEIQVIAEKPLIQRNTTNTLRTATQEEVKNLPVRGVQAIVALQPGVVQQNGNLYVRGGRSGDVAYYVDGAPVTNPLNKAAITTLIPEGVEEIQLQAGGFTAEFGGANAGIVSTNMRTGGTSYSASVTYETDDLAKPGKQLLGTTNQGLRNVVATLGGPIVEQVRFFALYSNAYVRNRNNIWITPFEFSLVNDQSSNDPGRALPYPLSFKQNYLPNNWQDAHTAQGNILFDLKSIQVRLSGSYEKQSQTANGTVSGPADGGGTAGGGWPGSLYNYYRQNRYEINDVVRMLGGVKLKHAIDASTYYELTANYQRRTSKQYDPQFKDDWQKYPDSVANAALGYTGWRSRYIGPADYRVVSGFYIANENKPNNFYNKQRQESIGGGLDFVRQMSKNWELKLGGRYDRWTMRSWQIGNVSSWSTFLYNSDGTPKNPASLWANETERSVRLARAGTINYYGYDVDGNEIDSGVDAPYHPISVAGYIQAKFEYQDFVFNAGLRYEYFKPNHKTFPNSFDPQSAFEQNLDVIDQSKLVDAPTFEFFLPRLSFSFPVSDATVFYAQYGKYAQMPALNLLYYGNTTLSRTVSPQSRGNAYLQPVGYLLTPERSTQYEIGIRQMLTDNLAFTLSGFYKDQRDQAQVRNVVDDQGVSQYRAYQNVDFGTVKGLEFTLELRRTSRFAARVNYTMSDALGTGSNPNAAFGIVEQGIGRQINFVNPLGFNQRHKADILLDYRWDVNEGGPVLSGLGANLLFTFNSGHPYTKIKELASLGQSDPFTVGTYPSQDPRFSYPAESVNNSSTPAFLNLDLGISKLFPIGPVRMEIFVHITNLLNTKQVLNVYPTTGLAEDDGWLNNPLATNYISRPQYADFYRAINLENRWSYYGLAERGQVFGNPDIYGTPRQIRVGARLEL